MIFLVQLKHQNIHINILSIQNEIVQHKTIANNIKHGKDMQIVFQHKFFERLLQYPKGILN